MEPIAPDVAWIKTGFVNLYFVGAPGGPWAVVDTGLPGNFDRIRDAAEARFGKNARPEAIYLTHGHFDHAGNALALATYWDVPVTAHRLEMPYLTGRSDYPPVDPTPGGAIAFMSRFFPSSGIDLGDTMRVLPESGDLPGLPGWEVVETPGHSPGHVSFFRRDDGMLLAGDAFTTVDLDSPMAMVTQERQIARPPTPFTCDWPAARRSLHALAELKPVTAACGHGTPLSGAEVAPGLAAFAEEFIAPLHGRYVPEPARAGESGVVSLPPAPSDPLPRTLALVGIAAIAGAALAVAAKRRKEESGGGAS